MAGNVSVGIRVARLATLLLATVAASSSALAADCPGRPDALGTSRTLVVDPKEHPLIGTMQYRETLPLNDGEVVLTFDDGPLPKYSYQILDILAAQCVKATFFLVGQQAKANPEGVRKLRAAGHTIATHTQNHPYSMQRMPIDRAQKEIDDGIASVTAALGDGGAALAPFFRVPGLARNDGIEEYAKSKGLQIWSADFPADDWRHVSSQRVYELAMQRLKAAGKGILLLHDIQPRTVAALPRILQDLKARGYKIVHVVPASPGNPATPTDPQQWRLHPTSEEVATSRWPKAPNFVFTQHEALPAPLLTDAYWNDIGALGHGQARSRGIPLPRQAPWPRQVQLASSEASAVLPVPAASVFDVEEGLRVLMIAQTEEKRPQMQAPAAAHAKRRPAAAAPHGKRVARTEAARPRVATPAAHPAAKRATPDKKGVKRAGHHNQQARL